MSLYSIKHRLDGSILFEIECNSFRLCVKKAVKVGANLTNADLSSANLAGTYLSGVNLTDANLSGTNLACADLSGANLTDANLSGAKLSRADLSGANLACAYLSRANLSDANLSDANLSNAYLAIAYLADADLSGADLSGADLSGANLARTDLSGADLSGANLARTDFMDAKLAGAKNLPLKVLRAVCADFFDVLLRAIPEVPALLQALREGKIDGSTYKGCLWGTIANIRGVDVHSLRSISDERLAERWFHAINRGDTPATNAAALQVEAWIVEFMELVNPEVISDDAARGGKQ